ncbi:hypothetical protein [Altererythrobacter sp.]|uniref:hypothetical protein n=1 Tax=Altererythrobacter sp. TaxID=1872480 RepID=UPI003D071F62
MNRNINRSLAGFIVALALAAPANIAFAQDEIAQEPEAVDPNCDAACQAARKAANPLGDIAAIMTDNTIAYKTGTNDQDSYNFQIQPVFSVPLDGANLIMRGVIPVQGVQPDAAVPPILPDPTPNTTMEWGIGDTIVQMIYSPTGGKLAYGFGLQVSLPTHSKPALEGPSMGAGPTAVVFGQSGDLSWGGVIGHLWGQDGFSVTTMQPILIYGFGGGWYGGYNNTVAYNWSAPKDTTGWSVPLGLTGGRTILLNEQSGTSLDVSLGYYWNVSTPKGAADRQLKFGVSLLF